MLFQHQVVVQCKTTNRWIYFTRIKYINRINRFRDSNIFWIWIFNHENEQRNFRFIAHAHWSSNVANVLTELPHDLSVDSRVELINIKSSTTYDQVQQTLDLTELSMLQVSQVQESLQLEYQQIPEHLQVIHLTRTTSLPHFKRKNFETTYFIQDIEELQQYKQGEQDGIYYLTPLNANNKPVS